ncbi:N-acetylmuramoyl-L-alanine amidase [bacterium]|nr:N-acetylmuramoyl-L-alanine amidase [bacterium]
MKKIILTILFIMTITTSAFAQLKTYVIGTKNYIHASDFAREFEMDFEWDDALRILSLKNNSLEIKVMDDDNNIVVNNEIYRLDDKIITFKGGLFFPIDFMGKIRRKMELLPVSVIRTGIDYSKKFSIKKIIIDAGHGGKDSGAVSKNGIQEKDVVLDIALRVKRLLEASGFEVIMTRDRDVFMPLSMRSKIANKAKADLFISIHANAAKNRNANGLEVYYLSDAMDDQSRAIEAAENEALKYEDKLNSSLTYNMTTTKAALWDLTCDQYRK